MYKTVSRIDYIGMYKTVNRIFESPNYLLQLAPFQSNTFKTLTDSFAHFRFFVVPIFENGEEFFLWACFRNFCFFIHFVCHAKSRTTINYPNG